MFQYKQESWKGDNKLKAFVVCNLSGWKGISEKHIVDCPMYTQLCNHTKWVSLSQWVIQVKREKLQDCYM